MKPQGLTPKEQAVKGPKGRQKGLGRIMPVPLAATLRSLNFNLQQLKN